jgi:hypothetical protein
MRQTIFLLSPADCSGKRAQLLLNPEAEFPLAVRLRCGGAMLGEVFSFLSGLYFRGKLAYAQAFVRAHGVRAGVLVITPGRGLLPHDETVRFDDLRAIAAVGVSLDEPRYREPLERDASMLAGALDEADTVVLLGSIATNKYVDVLERCLDRRLHFPSDFVGRGDMSRGGLMLRRVLERRELIYIPLAGAVRRGNRPPKLEPLRQIVLDP